MSKELKPKCPEHFARSAAQAFLLRLSSRCVPASLCATRARSHAFTAHIVVSRPACAAPPKNRRSSSRTPPLAHAFCRLHDFACPLIAELFSQGARVRHSQRSRLHPSPAGRLRNNFFAMPGGRPAKGARTAAANKARRKRVCAVLHFARALFIHGKRV